MIGLGFSIFWLSSLLLVRGFSELDHSHLTELNLIGFTITPGSSPDASKSTWQWFFDELRFVRGKVYDVCDVLPKLLRTISPVYGVRLVTCRQQPWDQPSDGRTVAELFFDSTYFDQTQYTKPCLDKIAGEIEHILQGSLINGQLGEKKKLFTVMVQDDTVDVYAFNLNIGLRKPPKAEELTDDMGASYLKTSFGARRALINRRISAIREVEPLVVETEKMQVSNFGFKVFLTVYVKKASISQMSARDVYSSLDRIHSIDEEDAEDSDSTIEIIEIGNWRHATQRKKTNDYLNVLTHACTTFKSDRIQIVRIDGPVLLGGVEASNPGESKARSAVFQQITDVARTSQNKVPVPQNIGFVATYEASKTNGIYELYFYPPSGRAIAPELQTAFRSATAGFSNDSVVQEHIENCLVSSQEFQIFDYRISARVQKDRKWLVWESRPSESSEEYQKVKDGVTQYMRKNIEKTPFARSLITMKVEKLFSNYVYEVYVELRMTFNLIGMIQAIGYSTQGQLTREPRISVTSALKNFTWNEAGVVQVILEREHAEMRGTQIVCGDEFQPFAGVLVQPQPHSMEEHMEHHMAGHGLGTGDSGEHGGAQTQEDVAKDKDSSDRSASSIPLSILILVTLLFIGI